MIKSRTIVDSSTGYTARIRGSELVGDLGKTVRISIIQSFLLSKHEVWMRSSSYVECVLIPNSSSLVFFVDSV